VCGEERVARLWGPRTDREGALGWSASSSRLEALRRARGAASMRLGARIVREPARIGRAGADSDQTDRAVEHGLRARRLCGRPPVSRAHDGRSVESPEPVAGGRHSDVRAHRRRGVGSRRWRRHMAALDHGGSRHGIHVARPRRPGVSARRAARLHRPGKPVENAHIESFNGRCATSD
jgi:hypothetical protein